MKEDKFSRINKINDIEFELISNYTKIRNENKISQRKLAELTDMAQSTIARTEKSVTNASLSTFLKMIDALGYHIEIVKNK